MRLIESVAAAAGEGLAAAGFRKRAGQIYTLDLGDDALGWLGLNSATQHLAVGVVEVNPVVGVRHQGVERMVAELMGVKFDAYRPPTVSSPIGYLMPGRRYRAWRVDTAAPGEPARELVEAVLTYGVPFMRSAADLRTLCRLLDEGMGFDHQLVFRRPVAWLLAGDRARAEAALERALADLGERRDPAAEQVRRFAAAARARMAA